MMEILTPTTDAEHIKKLIEKQGKVARNRTAYERQWLTNIAFLYGKQHYIIEKRPISGLENRIEWEFRNLERKRKTMVTVNYILPLYRSLLSRMLLMRSKVQTSPETQTQRDIQAAKVGQELLEDFWDNVNVSSTILSQDTSGMQHVLAKLFGYMLGICRGYLKPYFNPDAVGKAMFPGEDGNPEIVEARIGSVEVEVLHPFEVIMDPVRRWACQSGIRSVDELEMKYGVRVEGEDVSMSEFERQLISLLEGTAEEKYENSAKVYQWYELPSSKHPNGIYSIFTEKKFIRPPDSLPEECEGKLPFHAFDFINIPLAHWPQSMVEQLIPLQEDYNFTVKRIRDYKKWMTGKVIVPDGCKMQTKWDDEVGQIVKYGGSGKPDYMSAPNIPQSLFEDLHRIRKDMEDIAATHDVSMSRVPSGVKSGVALEQLSEADNSQLAPQLKYVEAQLGFFSKSVLKIMQKKYNEKRLLNIVGDQLSSEVRAFSGEESIGNYRIKVNIGSSLPFSKEARQTFIMTLAKEGYITREKALALLEFGDVEGVYTDIDKQAEKSEIQEELKGVQFQPMLYENHATRMKIRADYMMGEEFKTLNPEVKKQMFQHYLAHAQFMQQEAQVMQPEQGQPQQGQQK